ncbi:MAG: PaaI family thioesterase [Chitinophagales bacterium]|nr:PaaI family thioesterase [Chitinophagales bacterium]
MNERVAFFRRGIGNDLWKEHYPIIKFLNGSIVEVNEGQLIFEFTILETQLNPNGILHGGVMATMLDELMGGATWTLNKPYPFATINLQVDYLSPAKVGEVIRGEANVIKAGSTVVHAEAKLYNSKNLVIAKATSNLVVMKPKSL